MIGVGAGHEDRDHGDEVGEWDQRVAVVVGGVLSLSISSDGLDRIYRQRSPIQPRDQRDVPAKSDLYSAALSVPSRIVRLDW
jgi:hypothetical protein